MSLQKIISNYSRYNHWANEKMTQWLQTLNSNLLYKETPSSFASIDLTVQHMNQAQNFWLTVITGDDLTHPDETIQSNAAAISMNNLLEGSQRLVDTCEAYSEEDLLQQLSSTDMIQPRYEYILQLINHNSYHRGQIVTMSRCLGVTDKLPSMDYEVFLWSVY